MNSPSRNVDVLAAPEAPLVAPSSPRVLVANQRQAARLSELDATLTGGSLEAARMDAARLRQLARQELFTQPPDGAVIVYRLAVDGHAQTGVLADIGIRDYRAGRVRRHEATQPERVRRLEELLAATRCELVPIMLTHQPRPRLGALTASITQRPPDVELAGDNVSQSVWIEQPGALADDIRADISDIDTLYIADGHHRMAAAERYATHHLGGGDDAVLGVLFPADQLRLLGYHRCLPRPGGVSASDLLDVLASQPATESLRQCLSDDVSIEPGTVAVWLDGHWYRLRLRVPRSADPCASLDVTVLEEGVLGPLAGATGTRVLPLPGNQDARGVADWCADHNAIGFLLHPPSVADLFAVADAGKVMPPKSTWFDPKARAGPFLRDLG
ncbi:DUF1015 family protein [Haloechinothrix halophila]|uniref:DUF1015 family protein n=1 Tax=Haloechinothrix halophila TaxID=1069073 RepID=UPI000420F74A|nr:DUF1015 family protein [Haloechinothrix halophila]